MIVLDGTADLSPMYNEDYIYRLPNRQFLRSLSYLTLVLCDLDTTLRQFKTPHNTLPQMITRYLRAATSHDPNLVLFTHQATEAQFTAQCFDKGHTGHFNNIKGLNSYASATNIAQIGLNRMPSAAYLTIDLAHDEAARTRLDETVTYEDAAQITQQISTEMEYNIRTAVGYMLADIEQNFYRSAIRRSDNLQPVTYYLFFNHRTNQLLIDTIRERYTHLGAKISVVEKAELERYRPMGTIQMNIARIQRWYEEWDGTAVKRKSILEQTGLTAAQYNRLIRHPDASQIKDLLTKAALKAHSMGKPQGWYAK